MEISVLIEIKYQETMICAAIEKDEHVLRYQSAMLSGHIANRCVKLSTLSENTKSSHQKQSFDKEARGPVANFSYVCVTWLQNILQHNVHRQNGLFGISALAD